MCVHLYILSISKTHPLLMYIKPRKFSMKNWLCNMYNPLSQSLSYFSLITLEEDIQNRSSAFMTD